MRIARLVCDLFGIARNGYKCRISGKRNLLGMAGYPPCRVGNFALPMSLTPCKSLKWKHVLCNIDTSRNVTRAVQDPVIGRLGFARSAVCSRFARCVLHPLYAKLYSPPYYTIARGRTIDTFKWRSVALSMLPARVISKRVRFPDFTLCAGASFEKGRCAIADILFGLTAPQSGHIHVIDAVLAGPTTPQMIGIFRQAAKTFGLELLALPMALYQLRFRLRGRAVVVCVGNSDVRGSIVKGHTSGQPGHSYISGMWMVAASLSTSLWFGGYP